ncbi:TVP38/TMEM64 family protein [Alicyclobacillus sp. SO9]|uniref:TVP38/TMEM64 family protein n=1 Tax=Alicyclobacillus sp. SO9 TaxID=2665646 RepID=UPI0018E7E5F2|nr:VTT domain-containing protein [Alicyclobacillus sp. SO9]QQE77690.1 VTT domain-containing protein [Alicyclobacillus sp. SO9]
MQRWQLLANKSLWVKLTVIVVFCSLLSLIYLNSNHHVIQALQGFGWGGIVISIFLMTMLCLTPIPSESLLFVLMRVYGIAWGVFYGWIGLVLSSIIIFIVMRKLGSEFVQSKTYPKWFQMIDSAISTTGIRGLLISRLLPIPAFFSSLIIAIMPSVRFRDYLWTSAVSVIPYYLGIMLIYKGLTGSVAVWLPLGVLVLLGLSLLSSRIKKRQNFW